MEGRGSVSRVRRGGASREEAARVGRVPFWRMGGLPAFPTPDWRYFWMGGNTEFSVGTEVCSARRIRLGTIYFGLHPLQ